MRTTGLQQYTNEYRRIPLVDERAERANVVFSKLDTLEESIEELASSVSVLYAVLTVAMRPESDIEDTGDTAKDDRSQNSELLNRILALDFSVDAIRRDIESVVRRLEL